MVIWDLEKGEQVLKLEGHTSAVLSVAYAPDGKTIATGSADMTVRLWDAATGKELAVLRGHTNWAERVVFAPDGKLLVSAADGRLTPSPGDKVISLTGG